MNPSSVELSLSLKPTYVPKSLSSLLLELSRIDNGYSIEKLKEEFLNIKKGLQTKREIQEITCSTIEEDCAKKQKTLIPDNFQLNHRDLKL
ncbi:hypothetical protein V6N13_067846 [Hibiscus sabdariffa]